MINVAILGASGYTGSELTRLLSGHPYFKIVALSADRKAGKEYGNVFPHLRHLNLPKLVGIDTIDYDEVNLVFCALPHATSQTVISDIPDNIKVIDLSADFRLRDISAYKKWYGVRHSAPQLQKEAVYGLTEFYREEISKARLVACTGCNAAAGMFPLLPLLQAKLIDIDGIIIDLATGVSGAGRTAKENILHSEISEGFSPYNVACHRHLAEFEQEFSKIHGKSVSITFTPHLLPQNRGILATIYVVGEAEKIYSQLQNRYSKEPFVMVLPLGEFPSTKHVRGSNFCHLGVVDDKVSGKVILFSAIDNLIKGASGQALQNANVMFDFPETLGLEMSPIFP